MSTPGPAGWISDVEAQWITWRLLGPRGAYNVPVPTELSPNHGFVDIQYGSGKGSDLVGFCEEEVGFGYSTIWGRFYDEGQPRPARWRHAELSSVTATLRAGSGPGHERVSPEL